jgi:hypothetical protein
MLRPVVVPIVEPRWGLNVDALCLQATKLFVNVQRNFYGACGGKVPVKNVSAVQEEKCLYIDGK